MNSKQHKAEAPRYFTLLFFGIMLAISVFSCQNMIEADDDIQLRTPIDNGGLIVCSPLVLDPVRFKEEQSDQFSIDGVEWVDNQCLSVKVNHGGGCEIEKSVFELLAQETPNAPESSSKSFELRFVLKNDDQCEALLHRTLYFSPENLGAIPVGEQVTLHIVGWGSIEITWPDSFQD